MSVAVGQVWSDKDPRASGRTIEVMDLSDTHAVVRLNTLSRNVSRSSIGRRTKVRLDRFGQDYELSDTPPHRFGIHRQTRELGYHPKDEIDPQQ